MKLKQILIALLILTFGCVASAQMTDSNGNKSTWSWINQDGSQKIEVKVENKVEFNDDYSDVASIPGDGALRIFDSRGSRTFKLHITRGAAGDLKREYSVDGRPRELDAEGRSWLREVLLQAARQGGLDARNRVRRIATLRGARGVAEEITHLKGDYVRRIYFEEFLQISGVSDAELKTALRNASQTIDSDYERAQLLLQVARVFIPKRNLIPEYFAALNRMESDYERRRTLSGVLKKEPLNGDALAAMVQSAKAIGSDYEKAVFLIQAVDRYHGDDRLRADWFNTLRSVGSDYEHHRVLSGLLKVTSLSTNALVDAMESASQIESDYEKASFLIEALGRYQSEPRLRTALINAAKTIGSDYERGRVQKRLDRADF